MDDDKKEQERVKKLGDEKPAVTKVTREAEKAEEPPALPKKEKE